MTYKDYQHTNNAQTLLAATITASATTMICTSGEGSKFPSTFPFLLTLENLNSGSVLEIKPVLKREIVEVTGRTGDIFTIVRSAEECLPTDESGTQGTTPFEFLPGDLISLRITAGDLDDINEEITRLESIKLDDGSTRTGMGLNKVLYTDNSGNEIELALGASGTFLKSTGTSSAPLFEPVSSSVDINGKTLTTANSGDELLIYDSSIPENRKIVALASTSNPGLVESATNAENISGTDSTRYTNTTQNFPKKIYQSGYVGFSSDSVYTLSHNLGVTATDVSQGRYKLVICMGDINGINGGGSIYGDSMFDYRVFGNRPISHLSNLVVGMINYFSPASPGSAGYAMWQANTVKMYMGLYGSSYLGRVLIIKMY